MKPTDSFPHPTDWHTDVIGNVIELKRGVSWSKDQEHSEHYDGAVPVIGISNVQDQLELEKLVYLSGLKPRTIEAKRVEKGWSVMVGSNGNRQRVGNAVYIAENAEFLFASFLMAAKPKADSGITPEFFYRWLRTEEVQAYLSASAEGSTGLNNLSHSFFRKMTIAHPGEAEQAAIACVLDVVDSVTEKARKALQEAERVKLALTQKLFTEGTRNEELRNSPVGYIPKSWQVKATNSVVTNFEYGLSMPMHAKGSTPILRMGNVQQGNIVMDDLKYVTLPSKLLSRYSLKRGDVLFNRTNSQEHVGKVGIYRSDEAAVFASYLIRLHPDPAHIDNYYLGQQLNAYSCQCRIKRYATPGVQQVNINAKNLGKVLIPVPVGPAGLDEQREIAAILEQADESVRAYGPVVATLAQIKNALMRDLLTGKVRVGPSLFEENNHE